MMRLFRGQLPVTPPRIAVLGAGTLLLAIASTMSDFVNISRGVNGLAVIQLACFASALALLIAVSRDIPDRVQTAIVGRWGIRGRIAVMVFMVLLTTLTFLALIGFLHSALFESTANTYWNDVISFNAANAQAVLHGRNPYTDDANFVPTLLRYPQAPPTPIQGPIFGYGYLYPIQAHVFTIDKAYLRNPAAYSAAFDPATLHSYPALSFLLYIPLVLLGQDILWLHLLAYALIFVWLVSLAPKGQRGWVALAAAAAVTIPLRTLMIDTEILCLVFLFAAWHYRENRWISAIALGLGCAFKQYCWIFAPFILLDALMRHGWREALKRGVIAGVTFLLPNLPFILMSPRAWLTSVFLPLSAALFPQGVGLVSLSLGHLLPGWPPLFYAVAELLAFAGVLWLAFRFWNTLRESLLLLALIPLVFAFRSPANYFAVMPWLALYAMLMLERKHAASATQPAAEPARATISPATGAR